MLRIVHLSDLHLHKNAKKADNRNAVQIVNYLKDRYKCGEGEGPTYIVLTGDLVDDGREDQFKHLSNKVIKPLKKAGFKVLPVPGNHDYAKNGLEFREGAPALYREFAHNDPNQKFPDITPADDEQVRFIGLDSADRKNKVWAAEGIIGERQRIKLAGELDACHKNRIYSVLYLHHHPFYRYPLVALRDWEKLKDVIENKVSLVLFGHRHVSAAYFGHIGVPHMLASGKVTEPDRNFLASWFEENDPNALAFRVIEIDKGKMVHFHKEEIKAAP